MKNKERFAKEIAELACNEPNIAVSKATGSPINCNIIKCDCCALYKGGIYNDDTCCGALKKWAESEYIEKTVISKKDRAFLEYLGEELKYIVRSKSDTLIAYQNSAEKREDGWVIDSGAIKSLQKLNIDFPMVKWSDEEPWLIEDLKNLEVVDSYE